MGESGSVAFLFKRKGIISYVDGRDLRGAVNALRHAFNKNVKDEKILGLLNMVEKEAGVAELTRRVDGPEQFTWVDQKIFAPGSPFTTASTTSSSISISSLLPIIPLSPLFLSW
jgi:hypothetical protein